MGRGPENRGKECKRGLSKQVLFQVITGKILLKNFYLLPSSISFSLFLSGLISIISGTR